ncbi:methyltransferase family protein [Pseudazoarcus pumilus]|uniref:Isoprenylcysteine carboxylmethyltransferase family protein n=1 Tax=Pseudazoarcus pumilus TaxID=2067960 RepID=A0A2I6S9Q6_9RHOO|nr:isoprenylcysteine carboxylmethyltransferase family protein [Pseudazoarcus pumilus]AUN95993.1 isoprenylcysteine carboxylmethyltransferase family protein [Pseudazoarcus pumilus]
MRFLPPPVVALLVGLLMFAADRVFPIARVEWSAMMPLAGVLAAGALAVMVFAVIELTRVRTTVNPTRPERTTTLVTRGVFAFSRNPIYLGDVLLLAAWALWLGSFAAAPWVLLFVAWIDRVQIPAEEAALRVRFGDAFEAYRRRVRRWI